MGKWCENVWELRHRSTKANESLGKPCRTGSSPHMSFMFDIYTVVGRLNYSECLFYMELFNRQVATASNCLKKGLPCCWSALVVAACKAMVLTWTWMAKKDAWILCIWGFYMRKIMLHSCAFMDFIMKLLCFQWVIYLNETQIRLNYSNVNPIVPQPLFPFLFF